MAESIIRSSRRRGFTTVYREVAQDRRLSLKARGLFLLLQSLPETWQYTISGLATLAGTGKDQIRSGLKELLDVGYLVKEQSHDSAGKFAGNVFVLQETAPEDAPPPEIPATEVSEPPLSENPTTVEESAAPLSEKPSTGNPSTENPTLREYKYNKKINKTPKAPKRGLKTPGFVWECVENFLGSDPEYMAAFEGFLTNREALKNPVLTTRSINTIINRLRPYAREEGIAMLDKAVQYNWLTVYPLKEDERPRQPEQADEARRGRCL